MSWQPRILLISSDSDAATDPRRGGRARSASSRRPRCPGRSSGDCSMADAAGTLRVVVGGTTSSCARDRARAGRSGADVVAQAGDADDLLRKALAHRPDIAIVDVQMPPHGGDDGLVAAIELRRRMPAVGVLVLSQFNEESYALDLIGDSAEGVGYLLKERVGDVDTFVSDPARGHRKPPWTLRSSSECSAGTVRRPAPRSHAPRARRPCGDGRRQVEHGRRRGARDQRGGRGEARHRHLPQADIGVASTEHRRVRAVLTYVRSAGIRVS